MLYSNYKNCGLFIIICLKCFFFSRNSMVLMVPEVHSLLGMVSASICRKKEELRGERKSEKGEC